MTLIQAAVGEGALQDLYASLERADPYEYDFMPRQEITDQLANLWETSGSTESFASFIGSLLQETRWCVDEEATVCSQGQAARIMLYSIHA